MDHHRILHVYLNGNTKDGGAGYVSLYVEIDKSGFVDSAHQEVYADLRFYIFNRNERKYFTIQGFCANFCSKTIINFETSNSNIPIYIFYCVHCRYGCMAIRCFQHDVGIL